MGALTFDEPTHTYRDGDRLIAGVTDVIRAAGLMPSMAFVPHSALDRGRYVHRAIAWWLEGALDETNLDPEIVPRLDAYKLFRSDVGDRLSVIEWETPRMLSTFAGTPDQVVMLDGVRTVIDLKCGGTEPWHAIQGSAYQHLTESAARAGLYLRPNGTYRLVPWKDRQDWPQFQAALTNYLWRDHHGLLPKE